LERCVVALTSSSVNEEAYSEVQTQLNSQEATPILIIVFAEVDMLWFFASKLQSRYPDAVVIGSSTYINYSSEGYSHCGASVLAINYGIEVSAGAVFDVDRHPSMYKLHIKHAMEKLSSYENTCCLEFVTSFGKGEELVLDTFEEVLEGTGIRVAGGSAGAPTDRRESFVALGKDLFKQTCVFVFIHNLNGKIGFFRENVYKPTAHRFSATYVDCEERLVVEYDGQPAATILAKTLNVPMEKLEENLFQHPMGRLVDGDIYITSADQLFDDGSISYYSRIYNHTKMLLLEPDDMRRVWRETAQRVSGEIPNPSFSISINCFLRTMLFESENCFSEFVNELRKYGHFIGVSGCGEQLDYIHLNQTMVLIVFE
jgi:hypothetical protein